MAINVADVKKVIDRLYGCKSKLFPEDECLIFGLLCEPYRAHVAIRVFDKATVGDTTLQALGISFSFVKSEDSAEELDFRHKPYTELLDICNELQHTLDWSAVSPCRLPNGAVEIALYRACNTSRKDLDQALSNDQNSEFLTALLELSDEFEKICPIVHGFYFDKITTSEYVKAFLDDRAPTQTM